MSIITRTYSFTDGTTAYGSQVESEIANIVNTLNSLDNAGTTWTNVKVTTLTPLGNIAMNSNKLTGLTPGTSSGDSVSYEQISGFLPPTGAIIAYGSASAPTGWLTCDGSAVSRTTYSGLFSVISTTFGVGDGSSTFNLPDLSRRVLMGKGGSASSTISNTVGSTGGEETHTLLTAEMPSHTHTITDTGHSHESTATGIATFGQGSSRSVGTFGGATTALTDKTSNNATGISLANTGSGTAHNVIQPSIVVNYIIKT